MSEPQTFSQFMLWIFVRVCIGVGLWAVYMIPYIVARSMGRRQATAIGILNLFAGWTVIGWIGACVWAAIDDTPQSTS